MDLAEGWAPLCKFLGKPIPNEPFPRVNEADAVEAEGKRLFLRLGLVWLSILAGTGVAAYFGLRTLRYYSTV
jgi:hypothetical protein